MTKHALLPALSVLLATGGVSLAQQPSPGSVPSSLETVPVDPTPGRLLTATKDEWVTLKVLDLERGFGVARREGGALLEFRLPPYASLWRFGTPGARSEEFREGEQVLLRTASHNSATYAVEVRDSISEQLREGRCYRFVSQDVDNRRCVLQPIDAATGETKGAPLTLSYGKGTELVAREEPAYRFRVAPETKLWVNMGFRPGETELAVREVLDEASVRRYRRQQGLRLFAHADAAGAPAHLLAPAAPASLLRLFPGYETWAARLKVGDELRVGKEGAPLKVREVKGAFLTFESALPGKPGETVTLKPGRQDVSFARDVWPILKVNCGPCHVGASRGGYPFSSPERLRQGGPRGTGIMPGDSGKSMLYLTMTGDRNPKMPPDRDATPEQLDLIKRWIDGGATIDSFGP